MALLFPHAANSHPATTLYPSIAFCQTPARSIGGAIRDGAGVAVIHARVTLRKCGNPVVVARSFTDAAGRFIFVLPTETECYDATADASGFKAVREARVAAALSAQLNLLLPLQSTSPAPPATLTGDTTYNQLVAYAHLDGVKGPALLMTVHRKSSLPPESDGDSPAFGLWKAVSPGYELVRRLDSEQFRPDAAELVRFRGTTYVWFYYRCRHVNSCGDQMFRVERGGSRVIPVAINDMNPTLERVLRPGESLGMLDFSFCDDDLRISALICPKTSGCYPGDMTVDYDSVLGSLTIKGNVLQLVKYNRVTSTQAHQGR